MRILLLPHSYPPVLGGLQTVAHSVARHLVRQGHEVQVVTNRYPRQLPCREVRDGVAVSRWRFLKPDLGQIRRRRLALFLASLYCHPRNLFRLNRLVRSFRPDTVNVHFPDAQIPAVLHLQRHFRFRLVVSVHGHDVERFMAEERTGAEQRESYESTDLRELLSEATAVTACSRHLLEKTIQLEPSVASKGVAIHNGIDPQRFADTHRYAHPRPYLFALGRLTYKKGFDLLLQAFSRLGPGCQPVDLILAGEGEERDRLHALAGQLGLDGRVHFFGRASQEEVVQLLNGCLFVVVPSRAEPFGIVALEALAAGKPILATRVGGLEEFLTEFCSSSSRANKQDRRRTWLASPGPESSVMMVKPHVAGLAEGLRAWLLPGCAPVEPPENRVRVLEEYSWARVAQRYEQVLAG